MNTIIEKDCIFEFQGKKVKFGGSWVSGNKIFCYAYEKEGMCGNWHGTEKVRCYYGRIYRSNMGDRRQSVYFRYMGHNYYGVYYRENSQIIRARRIKD